MALQINLLESKLGVGFPDCYARINRCDADKQVIRVWVDFFANAAAKDAVPVDEKVYEIPTSMELLPGEGGPLWQGLYEWLKANKPVFAQGVDV
ncbi:MAG TPA: hypothetical protein V6D07_18750 [Trichocoleus sp.]